MHTDTPNYESYAYREQYDDWLTVNDCYEGTRRIREQTVRYLPQNPKETEKSYNNRLARSVFWNAYRRSIQGLVGMIFRKDPQFGSDVPTQIVEHWENIDLQGTHGDVFAKDVGLKAINNGHHFILVEMPPPLTDEEGNIRSDVTAEEIAARRPYWCQVGKEQVINWRTEKDDTGMMVLTQVTIREVVCEPSGMYSEDEITQYRVLRPGSWEIWREEHINKELTVAKLYDAGLTSLDFIPLVPVYAARYDFFKSVPPLLDLAHENLRHYRLQSDLDHILHIANVPILTRESASEEDLNVGGGAIVDINPGDKLYYTEHQGHAIGKAQEEIEKCKSNMAALGLMLLSQKPKAQATATEKVLESEAESSELASMARGIEDGLELALQYHAAYLGLDSGGSLSLNRDFSRLTLDAQTLAVYLDMVERKALTVESFWKILDRAEVYLPPDFDPVAEKAALDMDREASRMRADEALQMFGAGVIQ